MHAKFPEETFFFQAANITNQILNFGLPMPIDIQIVGRDAAANYQLAREISQPRRRRSWSRGRSHSSGGEHPRRAGQCRRREANQAGLTQRDVANSMLISLSSSGQVAPNQWLNPLNGVSYQVSVQTPQYRVDSFGALQRTPVTPASDSATQLLANLSSLERTRSSTIVNHYNVQPVFDVFGNADQRDLGWVASDIQKILEATNRSYPRPRKS